MSASLKATAAYTGLSKQALKRLADVIEPLVIAKLFGPPEKPKRKKR